MSDELFDLEAFQWPAWFQPSKHAVAQARNVSRGLHPLGEELLDPSHVHRCASCRHARQYRKNRGYWKCRKAKDTRCAATDLRLKWPACVLYEPDLKARSVQETSVTSTATTSARHGS